MKILLTGGTGYIGSHIYKLLKQKRYDVCIIDKSSPFMLEDLYGSCISDKFCNNITLQRFKPDVVIHLAGYINVGESVENPLKYYENNVANTITFLQTCLEHGVKKFIFSSSASVYDYDLYPISEDYTVNPLSPYGESKSMIEKILHDIKISNKDFKYIILRYFNVAGADIEGEIGESHNPETHLIPNILKSILEDRPFYLYGNDYPTEDGTCIRDYIHVSDIAEAHLKAIEGIDVDFSYPVFNVGYGKGYSIKQIIESIEKITGKKVNVIVKERRQGDYPILIADNTKIQRYLDWKPKYDDLDIIIKTAWEWEKKKCQKN